MGIDVNIIVNQAEETFPAVLAGILSQTICPDRLLILDNGEIPTENDTISHLLTEMSGAVEIIRYRDTHLPGVATARQFLLEKSDAEFVLTLDDDIFIYPEVMGEMWNIIREEKLGYVIGNVVEAIPFRNGKTFHPKTNNFEPRNHYRDRLYHPAYVHGGCVLYDRDKLNSLGGYKVLEDLDPKKQAGEDVWVQTQLQKNYGGLTRMSLRALHLIPKKTFRFEKDAIAGTSVEAGKENSAVADVLQGKSIAEVSIEYFKEMDNATDISR
jgi:glycosyltransferase involved in cell wall biosynthesis